MNFIYFFLFYQPNVLSSRAVIYLFNIIIVPGVSAGASGRGAPGIKSGPPLARGLARHNKRFTIEEIIKIVATRCQILRLKCTKSFVGWDSAPDPAGGACSAPQTS